MSLGFDLVDSDDKLTAKQVEMAVRQARAQQLKEQGMLSKDIAKELGVDPATVSRDLRSISQLPKLKTDSSDEGDDGAKST